MFLSWLWYTNWLDGRLSSSMQRISHSGTLLNKHRLLTLDVHTTMIPPILWHFWKISKVSLYLNARFFQYVFNWSKFNFLIEKCIKPTIVTITEKYCTVVNVTSSMSSISIQGSEIRYADSTKQVPSRARQNRQARAGINFTKPRTSLFSELCIVHSGHVHAT